MNKRNYAIIVLIVLMISAITPVFAVKPGKNLAASQKVDWNLSEEVMISPPWGLQDIPGSDDASKLMVNQPNGNVEVIINGVMKGLAPNLEYTVFLSNGYTKNWEQWSLIGDWALEFDYNGGIYPHDMVITTEDDRTFSGTGSNSHTWVVTGTKNGDGTISMTIDYDASTYEVVALGTIQADGSIQGTWSSNTGQSGTWTTVAGQAEYQGVVGTGYPGLFTSTVPTFTFTTDEYGCGNWHLNLRDSDFKGEGSYLLSVWINKPGRTVLISDNFTVEVD